MTFKLLHERVRQRARDCVRNGEVTERGLARITGVSQPHIHNVLKGVRALSTTLSDRLLYALKIPISDLVDAYPQRNQPFAAIPLLADRIGPGTTDFRPEKIRGQIYIPVHLADTASRPVAAIIGEDFRLPYGFAAGDLIVIHTKPFQTPDPFSVHVVLTIEGPRLRQIRQSGGDRVYIASEPYLRTPSGWEPLPAVLDPRICGRVAWASRHSVLPSSADESVIVEAPRGTPRAFGGQPASS